MTILTSQDILDIQNLVVDYCITTDNKDVEAFMECWVSAEEFGGYDSGAFGNMKTWDELYEFEKEHVGPNGMAQGKRHQSTNISIKAVSESEVLVTNDMIVLEVAEIPMVLATGRYDNSLVVKTDKGWRFKRRTLEVDSGFFKLMESQQQE